MRSYLMALTLVATGLFTLACSGSASVGEAPTVIKEVSVGSDVLTAGVHFGSELCLAKMGDNCTDATRTFAKDVPMIYFVHQSRTIPNSGQTYTVKWIAVDVGAAAPANTIIAELSPQVDDGLLLKASTHYTISSQLSMPTAGWPVGSYVVDVTLDGAPVDTAAFTIE